MAHYQEATMTVDDELFLEKLYELTGGKCTKENASVAEYVNYYGSTGSVADLLVREGMYTNRQSAMRQVQRMLKNPDIRVTPRVETRLSVLSVPLPTGVTINIRGYFTYDFVRWAFATFRYTPSEYELRSIYNVATPTNTNANQEALDKFLDAYGVGISLSFAYGTTITIN